MTPSNICNVADAKEVVLGYFSISGVTEERVFVDSIPGVELSLDPAYCFPADLPIGWSMLKPYYSESYLPVYLAQSDRIRIKYGPVNKCCVDCRDYKGSTHIKPEFW